MYDFDLFMGHLLHVLPAILALLPGLAIAHQSYIRGTLKDDYPLSLLTLGIGAFFAWQILFNSKPDA